MYNIYMYLASEQSEQDTNRGNLIENRGYLFIYIYVEMYVCHLYFDLRVFLCLIGGPPHPNSLNRIFRFINHYPITVEIELFIVFNSFVGAVKT